MRVAVVALLCALAHGRRRRRGRQKAESNATKAKDVFLLASYPSAGASWVRNIWDLSTGVASQSADERHPGDTFSARSRSWGSPCGSRRPPDERLESAKRCGVVRPAAAGDPVVVATRYPARPEGGDRRGAVEGIVVIDRSPRSWCASAARAAARGGAANCEAAVGAEMRKFLDFYLEPAPGYHAFPVLVLSYDRMAASNVSATREMRRMYDFCRARPVRNGVRRYPVGAPNGAAAPWEPPRSPIIQAAHDRYAAHGPRVNPLLPERRRGGFLEPKEGEFGVFEGVWISGPQKPPSREDLPRPRDDDAPKS